VIGLGREGADSAVHFLEFFRLATPATESALPYQKTAIFEVQGTVSKSEQYFLLHLLSLLHHLVVAWFAAL